MKKVWILFASDGQVQSALEEDVLAAIANYQKGEDLLLVSDGFGCTACSECF